jgi:hypothetical protein
MNEFELNPTQRDYESLSQIMNAEKNYLTWIWGEDGSKVSKSFSNNAEVFEVGDNCSTLRREEIDKTSTSFQQQRNLLKLSNLQTFFLIKIFFALITLQNLLYKCIEHLVTAAQLRNLEKWLDLSSTLSTSQQCKQRFLVKNWFSTLKCTIKKKIFVLFYFKILLNFNFINLKSIWRYNFRITTKRRETNILQLDLFQ